MEKEEITIIMAWTLNSPRGRRHSAQRRPKTGGHREHGGHRGHRGHRGRRGHMKHRGHRGREDTGGTGETGLNRLIIFLSAAEIDHSRSWMCYV